MRYELQTCTGQEPEPFIHNSERQYEIHTCTSTHTHTHRCGPYNWNTTVMESDCLARLPERSKTERERNTRPNTLLGHLISLGRNSCGTKELFVERWGWHWFPDPSHWPQLNLLHPVGDIRFHQLICDLAKFLWQALFFFFFFLCA